MTDYNDVLSRIQSIYKSSSEHDRQILLKILEEIHENGDSKTYENIWLQDYKEIPVDIETFLNDELFLGKATNNGKSVYPHWKDVLNDIFVDRNECNEIVLTGATRIGKTSTAITGAAYMLYQLMCLKDPQKFFDKKEVSKFSILFFNLTKDLAKGVAFREFNDTLQVSPWFNEHGTFSRSDDNFYYIPEGGKVVIDYGSNAAHSLGKQVYCGLMDEINFSRAGVKDVNKAKAHMQELYTTVADRIKGTFRMGGRVYGKLFAISSKRSDSDFMEAYVDRQRRAGADEFMYIDDKPQWEVLPKGTFHDETFYIAVGDRHHRGFVIENESKESLDELTSQGYRILNPPIDMKSEFTADFDIALRDLAGITVPGALSFITQDTLNGCIVETPNCFYNELVTIGTQDNYSLEEFFHQDHIDNRLKAAPMFIHLDLSLTTDKTGISGVAITGRKDIESGNKTISMPTFTHVFSVSLEAPRGDKIPYAKITSFITWLRSQKFNIVKITRDQFQSEYMAQLLEAQGFNVGKISLDRTPDGYMALRSVLLEKRMEMLDCKILQNELIHLQRDAVTSKIDHPVGGCFTKDTKIRVAGGRSYTIEELFHLQNNICEWEYYVGWAESLNTRADKKEIKPIEKVWMTKVVDTIIELSFSNGQKVKCTLDHKFLLSSLEYKQAKDLTVKDDLKIYGDEEIKLISSVIKKGTFEVYDLCVKDNHNYLLDAGMYVHNSKDVADSFAGAVWTAIQDNPPQPIQTKTMINAMKNVNRRKGYSPLSAINNPYKR